MALPKPMRYLAAVTLCIFVYLFAQILSKPGPEGTLQVPDKSRLATDSKHWGDWDHDPQQDRKAAACSASTRSGE